MRIILETFNPFCTHCIRRRDRIFSTSGPKLWSSRPSALSFAVFKRHLKSYLFNAIWDRGP